MNDWNKFLDDCVKGDRGMPPDFYDRMQAAAERDRQERAEHEQRLADVAKRNSEQTAQQAPWMAQHYAAQYPAPAESTGQEIPYRRPWGKFLLGMALFIAVGVWLFVNIALWIAG